LSLIDKLSNATFKRKKGGSVSLDALCDRGTTREFEKPALTPWVTWGNMRNWLSFYGRLGVPQSLFGFYFIFF